MSKQQEPTLVASNYHRNGVGGRGFFVTLFDHPEYGRMVGIQFGDREEQRIAVLRVQDLVNEDLEPAWRGADYFGDWLDHNVRE